MVEISLEKGGRDLIDIAEKLQDLLIGENLFSKRKSKVFCDMSSNLAVICAGKVISVKESCI